MNTMTEPSLPPTLVDIDAERRVLGILLKHPDVIDATMERLAADQFTHPLHRQTYHAILSLYEDGGNVSYTQVFNTLRSVPGVAWNEVLISITESFVSLHELEPSVNALLERAARRRILEAAEAVQKLVLMGEDEPLDSLRAQAQQIIFEAVSKARTGDDIKDLMDVLHKCYTELLERREGRRPSGILVKLPSIDAVTTGFKRGDLIILAARPSMGKTSMALNWAINIARSRERTPVLIFSFEMDDVQIGDRLVISELFRYKQFNGENAVTSREYNTRMDDEKFRQTESVFNELYDLPIKIVDRRGLTVAEIRAKARKVKAEEPDLGMIIIDYLQLIKPPAQTNKNWTLVVGDIVRELRDLAGELHVPVVLLSQLNRGVESRDNKRPIMSDLRDSGNIEEFADVVVFLYRDDYYYPDRARENGTEGMVDVIFAKQRKGPTGSVPLRFYKEYTRFVDEVAD